MNANKTFHSPKEGAIAKIEIQYPDHTMIFTFIADELSIDYGISEKTVEQYLTEIALDGTLEVKLKGRSAPVENPDRK